MEINIYCSTVGSFHQCYLSCILDEFLQKFKPSGIGCYINGNRMGVLSYAGYITLNLPEYLGIK